MNRSSSPSAPPRRARRITVLGLAVLASASVLVVLRGPLLMAAPACVAGRWRGCFGTMNGVVLMTLVGLPLAVAVAWALARRRRAGGAAWAWRRSLAEVGMVYGTVPLVWTTLMPGSGAGVVPGRVSPVPLQDLATMGPLGIAGNLLVFAALGFFAPMRFAAVASAPRLVALGACCSLLVETAQYAFHLDRVSSVDDVLVNATGALLAGLASRGWWRTAEQVPPNQPRPTPTPTG